MQYILNNRYKLVQVIGQGGMSRVYLAEDLQENGYVAIKECFVEKGDAITLERIKREFYFMNKIQHPNLIRAIDLFQQNKCFIVMEYVQGVTLKHFIRNFQHSISLRRQLRIMNSICKVVAVLNENGVIHRDLKPDNIILNERNLNPKLLDLGTAKSINNELVAITRTNDILGTPEYMSPEQINSDLPVGKNTDVFALGAMFYQFACWQKNSPFRGENMISTIDNVTNLDVPPLNECVDKAEEDFLLLSHILEGALKKDPAERIGSVSEMLDMFAQLKSIKSRTRTTINGNKDSVTVNINQQISKKYIWIIFTIILTFSSALLAFFITNATL